MAAAISLCRHLCRPPPRHVSKKQRFYLSSSSCRAELSDPGDNGGEQEGTKKKKKKASKTLGGISAELEKMGKGLQESLSPRQKGDWKDILLMSFSFAVYVYISQKLVCAYCAWKSVF